MRRLFRLLFVLFTAGFTVISLYGRGRAAEVLVAAASDLSFPIKEIIAEFEKKTGHVVKLTLGSSGNFQAQIQNGAPFDVYLSADLGYVRGLEGQGLIEPGTVHIYAVGRIVVWVPLGSPIDVRKLGMESLVHAKRIAIANPQHAPYGRAAVEAMRHFKMYERVASRLVLGENIAQAAQFVSSGAADVGVIALSIASGPAMRSSGSYWEVPLSAYPRMEQAMAILSHARKAGHLEAARAFHGWMRNDSSRRILERYGFNLPGPR